MSEMHSVTFRVKAAVATSPEDLLKMAPPECELLLDGQKFPHLLQHVKLEMDTAMMVPLVTISFIPKELVIEAEKAVLAMMQGKGLHVGPGWPGPAGCGPIGGIPHLPPGDNSGKLPPGWNVFKGGPESEESHDASMAAEVAAAVAAASPVQGAGTDLPAG